MSAFEQVRSIRHEQIREYWERVPRREDLSLKRRIPPDIWQMLMDAEAAGVDLAVLLAHIDTTTTPAQRSTLAE